MKARQLIKLLTAFMPPLTLSPEAQITIDHRILLFTLEIWLITSMNNPALCAGGSFVTFLPLRAI